MTDKRTIARRKYVNADATPHGSLARTPRCEHCDSESGPMVREDRLRGFVCSDCDAAMDEMFSPDAQVSERLEMLGADIDEEHKP